MRIYSWNMLFENKKLEEAFTFIKELEFDILCLQEAPDEFLKRLSALPFHMASAPDDDYESEGKSHRVHLAILSRYPIKAAHAFALPDRTLSRPLRGKIFVFLLQSLGIWPRHKNLGNRHGLYADLQSPRGLMRVFSLHLSVTAPVHRKEELGIAFSHLDPSLETIVCGDFNILESYRVSPASWLLGGTLSDVCMTRAERRWMEAAFKEHGFANPLLGHVTHPFSSSQLDHILLSKDLMATDMEVLKNAHGSDHRPIRVTL